MKIVPHSNLNNYVDCAGLVKVEIIEEEGNNKEDGMIEEIKVKDTDNIIKDIKEEMKDEESVPLIIQEEENDFTKKLE